MELARPRPSGSARSACASSGEGAEIELDAGGRRARRRGAGAAARSGTAGSRRSSSRCAARSSRSRPSRLPRRRCCSARTCATSARRSRCASSRRAAGASRSTGTTLTIRLGMSERLVNVDDFAEAARERLEPGRVRLLRRRRRRRADPARERRRRSRAGSCGRACWSTSAASTTATTVLGTEVALPVLVAPTAFQRLCDPEGELATARAAAGAGTVMCLSTLSSVTPAELAAAAPGAPLWFQLYWSRDRGFTQELRRRGRRGRLHRADADGRPPGRRPARARHARWPSRCRTTCRCRTCRRSSRARTSTPR